MEWGAVISTLRPAGKKQAEGTPKLSCSGKRSQADGESPELSAAAEVNV